MLYPIINQFEDSMTFKFVLGKVVATPGAIAAFQRQDQFSPAIQDDPAGPDIIEIGSFLPYLVKHRSLDQGELCDDDHLLNEEAVSNPQDPGRVHSHFKLEDGTSIWIITERDRSVTTILLPEEY